MPEVKKVPAEYTGIAFSVNSCTIHGAHLMLALFHEGDEVYTADLEPEDVLAISADMTAAVETLFSERAAFRARSN
jgi:hypothetical protein